MIFQQTNQKLYVNKLNWVRSSAAHKNSNITVFILVCYFEDDCTYIWQKMSELIIREGNCSKYFCLIIRVRFWLICKVCHDPMKRVTIIIKHRLLKHKPRRVSPWTWVGLSFCHHIGKDNIFLHTVMHLEIIKTNKHVHISKCLCFLAASHCVEWVIHCCYFYSWLFSCV